MTSHLLFKPGKLALTISLLVPLVVGCTTSQAVDQPRYSTTAAQASFSEAQLDALLAPIALYPDTVLSHVLIASTYPLEVVDADRWARNNSRLKGDDAVNAVDSKDWDPSVKALVAFPEILQRMSDDLDWTQQLGDAFLADEEGVMDSIQKLRNRAYASGNLDKVEHVRVIREEKVIVIEPSVERVVYVPAYDTRVVYGNWWWPDYPPVYWHYPSSYVFVSGFYWGPRVHIGPRFYFSGCHWRDRRVVVVDHHHHHHHGHRFYDSRSVVRHTQAKHWHHNPVHRRGVAYYDNHTRDRFHSPRESYRDSREYRANLRNDYQPEHRGRVIEPNRARDQRQGRDEQFQQRLQRNQAGQVQVTTNRDRLNQPRAEQLRERMNGREGRDLGSVRSNNDVRERGNISRPTERNDAHQQQNQNPTRQWENRQQGERNTQIDRTVSPRLQGQSQERIERAERPMIQRIERAQSPERTQTLEQPRYERPQTEQRIERRETLRMERPERAERLERTERPERAERFQRERSDDRSEIRGGRER